VVLKRKILIYSILTGQIILTAVAVMLSSTTHAVKLYIGLSGLILYIAGLIIINFNFDLQTRQDIGNMFLYIYRSIRHEFRNHLQVLFSMIQLKKYQDALKYIEDVMNGDKTINHIYTNLNDPLVVCCLLEIIYKFRQKNINITVEILEAPRLLQLWDFKRKMEKYILQFSKVPGKKDIKLVLKNSRVEVQSNALRLKVTL